MNALTINGRKPVNPFGSCFDAAALNLVANLDSGFKNIRMCHGVGTSNHPESMGEKIAHAWIECDAKKCRVAIDPIWMIAQPATHYRDQLKVELVLEYTPEEFITLWKRYDYPGPWDSRLTALTSEEKAKKQGADHEGKNRTEIPDAVSDREAD